MYNMKTGLGIFKFEMHPSIQYKYITQYVKQKLKEYIVNALSDYLTISYRVISSKKDNFLQSNFMC